MFPGTRILFQSLVAIFVVFCGSVAFSQTTPDSGEKLIHVSGRLVDSRRVPYQGTTVVFNNSSAGPQDEQQKVDTDQTGSLAIDLLPHRSYEIWVEVSRNSIVPIGNFSFGDVQSVDLGDIFLDSLPGDKFVLHAPGRFHFKRGAGPDGAAESTSGTIAAVYIDCPEEAHGDCRGGRAHIFMAGDRNDMPPVEEEQIGASQPLVAFNNRAAGWLVDFDNCCTSYPLSLPLVVYRPGKTLLTFRGDARAIFDWHFLEGGKRVAMCQEFPHGDLMPHYELHDMDSGRLLEEWDDSGDDENNNQAPSAPTSKRPAWVATFVGNC